MLNKSLTPTYRSFRILRVHYTFMPLAAFYRRRAGGYGTQYPADAYCAIRLFFRPLAFQKSPTADRTGDLPYANYLIK